VVTSISSGDRSEAKVSGVPQRGQKLRVPCADERNDVGWPVTMLKVESGTVNQVTNGAPLVPRQIAQWQFVSLEGGPLSA